MINCMSSIYEDVKEEPGKTSAPYVVNRKMSLHIILSSAKFSNCRMQTISKKW
jgi:hypothetical protein